jgi:hypothetical protein
MNLEWYPDLKRLQVSKEYQTYKKLLEDEIAFLHHVMESAEARELELIQARIKQTRKIQTLVESEVKKYEAKEKIA